jgi:hypothetical protein
VVGSVRDAGIRDEGKDVVSEGESSVLFLLSHLDGGRWHGALDVYTNGGEPGFSLEYYYCQTSKTSTAYPSKIQPCFYNGASEC